MRRSLILLLMTIICTACSGASEDKWTKQRPPTYPVSGTVNFNGTPLEGATVVFQSTGAQTQAAVGRTDKEGHFQMRTFEEGDGAIAGEHSVAITCVKSEGPAEGTNLDEADVVITETSLIPTVYGKAQKSGLNATVNPDQENTFIFELEDKKQN
ncbi:carboxypeptidase regulatory-like domain-containing protein [Gimesia sp.]|uniref:carboxypeptidase regulatory-like domain-containing protein n=1 Tax=Gimesia sp. TaxID=2024833 RepID=UPI003A91DC14